MNYLDENNLIYEIYVKDQEDSSSFDSDNSISYVLLSHFAPDVLNDILSTIDEDNYFSYFQLADEYVKTPVKQLFDDAPETLPNLPLFQLLQRIHQHGRQDAFLILVKKWIEKVDEDVGI